MDRQVTRIVAIVGAALVVAAGTWFGYDALFSTNRPLDGDSTAGLHGKNTVVALGRLEPATGLVSVGAPPGERLQALAVSEGDTVQAGQSLGTLESRSIRELEWKALQSQVAEAQARATAEENLADARITTANLALEKAEADEPQGKALEQRVAALDSNVAQTKRDLRRIEGLSTELIAEQEVEQQSLAVEQAAAQLAAGRAELSQWSESSRWQKAAAKADLAAAEANKQQVLAAIPVGSLQDRVAMAKLQLDWTDLTAPAAGTVLKVYARPGELIGNSPVLLLADLSQMVCIAEVYESDRQRVSVGQSAEIRSAALGSETNAVLHGKVARVGRLIATPQLKALDPFARADRRVIGVRIELDTASSQRAADLVNLEVEVTFGSGS